GNGPEDQGLHARRLAPVLLKRLQNQLDARRERHEPIRPGADRRLLEPVLTVLLDVLLRHDPARPGGDRVEGHEVRPRLPEADADPRRVRGLDRQHAVPEHLVGGAAIALQRELDVLGSDRLAIVKAHAFAEHELVDEPVRRRAPRLGQARRHGVARQRLHHRVVQRVQHHERGDDAGGLRRVEPGRREGEVHRPGQLALWRRVAPRRAGGREGEQQQRDEESSNESHRAILWQCRRTAAVCDRLRAEGHEAMVRARTGLVLDAYFSGTKIAWILDQAPDARRRAARGQLAFGTVDTWLLWKLTRGRVHATDVSNASRTLCLNLASVDWDDRMCALLDVPPEVLPTLVDSSG